jgi:hypothetical protein
MASSLQRLIQLEVPPLKPVAPGTPDSWQEVERKLNLVLPTDYKEYVRAYGAGCWANFFGIMNPFYRWRHPEAGSFYAWIQTRLEGLDEMYEKFPEYSAPFRRHPAPNGLFPFGYDDNGGTLCWKITRAPDSWPIVCLGGKYSAPYGEYDMTLTNFLVGLLSGKIFPPTFPPDLFPILRPAFSPYTTQ